MAKKAAAPLSMEELKRLRKPVRNTIDVHVENMSSLERFAMNFTGHIGSMTFFMVIFAITIIWLVWNTFAPPESRFDPYPAFVLWLFISNITQLLLMPLIMLSQNLQARYAEIRAQEDYEINLKAEREIETIIRHLEAQEAKMDDLIERLEAVEK